MGERVNDALVLQNDLADSLPVSSIGLEGDQIEAQIAHVAGVMSAYFHRGRVAVGGLFSERVGQDSTLLLDNLISSARVKNRPLQALDLGSGPGVHAITLATRLPATRVYAIDGNPDDVDRVRQKVTTQRHEFAPGSGVESVLGDALEAVRRRDPGSVDIVHSNSFLHIVPTDARNAHLHEVRLALATDGEVGASFKTEGDVQHSRGTKVGEDERGVYVADPTDERIVRLIVTRPRAIVRDFEAAGLRVTAVYRWGFEGYDGIPGVSEFVAFKAVKR